jgi:hypothetical protein
VVATIGNLLLDFFASRLLRLGTVDGGTHLRCHRQCCTGTRDDYWIGEDTCCSKEEGLLGTSQAGTEPGEPPLEVLTYRPSSIS